MSVEADPDIDPLRLLRYSPADKERPFPDRKLRWITTEEGGWIAEDNDQRELLRRFFPRLPVVCATLGPKVVKQLPWLAVRGIKVREEIAFEPLADSVDSVADDLRSRLEELLPALLAIAEVSRYTTQRINPQQVNESWVATQTVHVANVWIDFTVIAEGLESKTARWLKDSKNDVILDERRGIIYFDADEGNAEGPPLRGFGEPLAARLLGDRRVGPAWSNAITEYEAGGLARIDVLLRKSGAQALCESYRRQLRPLSSEARRGIANRIQTALARIGTSLRELERYSPTTRLLSPADLVVPGVGWGERTEDAVQRCLDDAGWTEVDYVFKPEFQCREVNRQAWEKWLETGSRRLRLLIMVQALELGEEINSRKEAEALLGTAMAQRLAASSSVIFARVAFDPEDAARAWLNENVTDLEEKLGDRGTLPLHEVLPPITRYKSVSAICTAGAASWSRSTFDARKPVETVLAPITQEQKAEDDSTKTRMGGDAEVALRDLIVDQTALILASDADAWNILSHALPPKGVVRRKFEDARNQGGPLADVLHVSATWGSAGYDLIGLERVRESDDVEAVRYEVKALPAAGKKIRVFLSPNELAVYRRVARNASDKEPDVPRYRGQWRLVGVEPDGRAVDITEFLTPLMDDSDGPLALLGRDGFAPDGLMLSISRRATDAEGS